MIGKSNIGSENLNTQLTAQETLIQTITESLVGKATLANATADKIIEGFCAYVGQQLIQGTAKDPSQLADLKAAGGYTKMAVDKFTFSTKTSASVSHSLGEIPRCYLLFTVTDVAQLANGCLKFAAYIEGAASDKDIGISPYQMDGYITALTVQLITKQTSAAVSNLGTYAAGVEYTLVTMA